MFTGIVTDMGIIERVEDHQKNGRRFRIRSSRISDSLFAGCSVNCSGVCLTVVDFVAQKQGGWFDVDISRETLSLTTLDTWSEGYRINLEGGLRLGSELGGHLVLGHVDGLAEIVALWDDGESRRFTLRVDSALSPFMARKGSVALDGVSLTVNKVGEVGEDGEDEFDVNLIPHTLSVTNWTERRLGDKVNVEIDPLARYVARLMEFRS